MSTRKPKTSQQPVRPRLTQRDLDSSSHRLSRVPQKFASSKSSTSRKSESYAVDYYNQHPDELDCRTPEEKLQSIDEGIQQGEDDRTELLMQKKALTYIRYGENSVEAARCHIDLGACYNENHRPQSAIRHLKKAQELERSNPLTKDESNFIIIELAEAHVELKTEDHLKEAERVISTLPETENQEHIYRRDLVKARILVGQKNYEEAAKAYETAWISYDTFSKGTRDEKLANLYNEIGDANQLAGDKSKAQTYFHASYDLFNELEMVESAERIQPKLKDIPTEQTDPASTSTIESEEEKHDDVREEEKEKTGMEKIAEQFTVEKEEEKEDVKTGMEKIATQFTEQKEEEDDFEDDGSENAENE